MRTGVDVGGTFTDLVCVDDAGALLTAKTPSTPDDPSLGVMDGLALLTDGMGRDLGGLLAAITLFIHGSTVATNLVVECNGVPASRRQHISRPHRDIRPQQRCLVPVENRVLFGWAGFTVCCRWTVSRGVQTIRAELQEQDAALSEI